jgi:mannosidase alpha-like ER degradation enhancer 2
LAIDLGERLLPAFDTPTGIPFGSINLRRGVDPTETPVASLAGAGSLALEMQMLSHLSGDPRFGCAARAALLALFVRRSPRTGLLGKHIDVASGAFTEDNAGIGSTADSFYEYLAKMALLFGDTGCWHMFSACATAAEAWSKFGDWYGDVEVHSGTPTRPISDALQGFWPGLLASLGDVGGASRSLNAFLSVAHTFGAPGAPEEFDFLRGGLPAAASGGRAWLLRPELLESAMHLRQATKGRDPNDAAADSWLAAGEAAVEALERVAKVHRGGEALAGKPRGCGFAAVADVTTTARDDAMPSYFLAETLKYVFLLFDDENWSHGGRAPPFVWTTEGHPLPIFPAAQVDTTPGGGQCGGFHGVMRGAQKAAAGDVTAVDAADAAEAAAIKKAKVAGAGF